MITVNTARDRHHPEVITGDLVLERADTLRAYYGETSRGRERAGPPALLGTVTWRGLMLGSARDSAIVWFGADESVLATGPCTMCLAKRISYDIFTVQANGFAGWWNDPRIRYVESEDRKTKREPNPGGYFCATRVGSGPSPLDSP
jgi:hypothetical protein